MFDPFTTKTSLVILLTATYSSGDVCLENLVLDQLIFP